MKSLSKTLLLLLLLATTVAAQASDDTVRLFRVAFRIPVTRVVLEDYSMVTVVADTSEYLTLANHRRIPSNDMLSYTIDRHGTLTLEAAPGLGRIELHLNMDSDKVFDLNDYCHLRLNDARMDNLSITTNDYTHAYLGTELGHLSIRSLNIEANDFSHVRLGHVHNCTDYNAVAHDFAHIANANGTSAVAYTVNAPITDSLVTLDSNGNVSINIERYQRDKHLRDDGSAPDNDDCIPIVDRSTVTIGWGINSWLSQPFNLFSRTDGDYEAQTAFRSFHLAYNWHFLRTCHWAMGIGVEYEQSTFVLANPHVQWQQGNGVNTFSTLDHEGDPGTWQTRLRTRYIGIPLHLRWSPNGEFYIGLTAIGSVNLSGSHTGLFLYHKADGHQSRDRQSTPGLTTPYKADVRLTVGGESLQFYIQATATDIFQHMDRSVYPAQIGFLIEL